jgi:hypothetical protein
MNLVLVFTEFLSMPKEETMKNLTLLILFTLTLSIQNKANATGSDNVGGGGDAVVCFETSQMRSEVEKVLLENRKLPENKDYNLLDPFTEDVLSESSVLFLDLVEFGSPGLINAEWRQLDPDLSIIENARHVFNKISKTNRFGLFALKQMKKVSFYSSEQVAEVDDSNSVVGFGPKCIIVQIAHRKDNRVYLNKKLFQKMPLEHKVALAVHEYIYSMFEDASETTPLRELVARIMTKGFIEESNTFQFAIAIRSCIEHFSHAIPVSGEPIYFDGEQESLIRPGELDTRLPNGYWGSLPNIEQSCFSNQSYESCIILFTSRIKLTSPDGRQIPIPSYTTMSFWEYDLFRPKRIYSIDNLQYNIGGTEITAVGMVPEFLDRPLSDVVQRGLSNPWPGIEFYRSGQLASILKLEEFGDVKLYRKVTLSDDEPQNVISEIPVLLYTPILTVFFSEGVVHSSNGRPNNPFPTTIDQNLADIVLNDNSSFLRGTKPETYMFHLALDSKTPSISELTIHIVSYFSSDYTDPLSGQKQEVNGRKCDISIGSSGELIVEKTTCNINK